MTDRTPLSLSWLRIACIVIAILAGASSATAAPIAIVSYVETEVVSGSF